MVLLAAGLRLSAPVDATPTPRGAGTPEVWRLLSVGRTTAAATVAWVGVVSRFADQVGEARAASADFVSFGLEPVHALDPRWSLPWMYGALMARHLGDADVEEAVLRAGIDRFPDTHWFPWALAMSRYLEQGDREEAARWLEHAASRPDAPPIHAEAARALRQEVRP